MSGSGACRDDLDTWRDNLPEQPNEQPDFCDDCHGYTHMPWCPAYEQPGAIAFTDGTLRDAKDTTQLATTSEQPASATGRDEWRLEYYKRSPSEPWLFCVTSPSGAIIARTTNEYDASLIITEHNQHQHFHEQNERLREVVRLAAEIDVFGSPRNRAAKDAARAALNHAEQGKGS